MRQLKRGKRGGGQTNGIVLQSIMRVREGREFTEN